MQAEIAMLYVRAVGLTFVFCRTLTNHSMVFPGLRA